MFTFPDIAQADRLQMLKWRTEAEQYWTFLKHLLGLWTGFGDRATRLISVYKWSKGQGLMVEELSKMMDWHDIKVVNIAGEMDRVNEYMRLIAIALGEAPLDAALHNQADKDNDLHLDEIT